jgi:hypothetical protein
VTSARTTRLESFRELLLRLELHAQHVTHAFSEPHLVVAGEGHQELRRRAEASRAGVEPTYYVRSAVERRGAEGLPAGCVHVAGVEGADEPAVDAGEAIEVTAAHGERAGDVGGGHLVRSVPDDRGAPDEQEQGEQTHRASVANLGGVA